MGWAPMAHAWRAAATGMALLAAAGWAAPALARTNHALLVAVTAYPNLPPRASLEGPNHDAVLVRDYLATRAPVTFAPDHLTLLADGVDGAAASPTHENIVKSLKHIAEKAVAGDFVYLHFSGHGAQQPERVAGSETDGLDEIFLPADKAKWVDRTQGVPGALMDDEIGSALDAIRARGAFVWVIFDACHSGTATREVAPVSDEVAVERKVDAETLGIPASEMVAAEAAASAPSAERQAAFALTAQPGEDASRAADPGPVQPTGAESIARGGMVAFFAAQTVETTPEMPLPKGAADAQKYGLFTYTIFSKLAEKPGVTYRQLAHAVLQQYAADSRQRPTPLFEGDLDARVFGSEKIDTVMQWPVAIKGSDATIPAGRLHRLSEGTRLAILPSPTAELSEAVGYLEVRSPKSLSAGVVPVAFADKPKLDLAALPPNAYARLAEVAIDFDLTVARPSVADGNDAAVALADKALETLATKDKRFRIRLVEPGAEADLRLAVLPENAVPGAAPDASDKPALFFLPPSGDLSLQKGNRPPLVGIDPAAPERLEKGIGDNLTKVFRATTLSRLAAASDYPDDQVTVAFRIRRAATDTFEPLDGSSVPIVNPDDEVHIEAENLTSKLVDINVLYVGSDYSITHITAQRLVGGAKLKEGLLAFTASSFGMERMIAVLTEAPPLSEVEDLSFLAQEGLPPATRAIGAPGDFSALLTDVGMAPATRAAMKLGDKGGQKGAVMIFAVETKPKE